MARVHWQDEVLDVQRVVVRSDSHADFQRNLIPLVRRLGLELADERASPQPGDFWVGCHPEHGWGDANPNRIGWASAVEVPVAIAALLAIEHRPYHRAEAYATARDIVVPHSIFRH